MDDLKQRILQELIDKMDERTVGDIKSKMPAKVEVAADSPESLNEGLEMAQKVTEDENMLSKMKNDDMSEDDEKLKELMEMYKALK